MSTLNEVLLKTLDIGNLFGPIELLASKIHNNSNLRSKITPKKRAFLLISIFLHKNNLHCLILC